MVDDVVMSRRGSVRPVGIFAALIGIAALCIAVSGLLHGHLEHQTSSAAPPTIRGEPRSPIPLYLRRAPTAPGQSKTPMAALSASYAWVQPAGFRSTWEIQLYAPGFSNATVKGQPFVTTVHGRGLLGVPVYGSGPGGPNVAFDGIGSKAAAVDLARSWTTRVTVLH
jgi:hypothetical protein